MSRYGDRFKDDLYDELWAQYEKSGLRMIDFLALVLEMLNRLIYEWDARG